MSNKAIAARLAATQLLHLVLFEKRLMSDLTSGEKPPLSRLFPADRARAQALATGVLRNMAALDTVLGQFLDKPPPPKVMNTLRLASYEMLEEGTAAHGAVNAAVEIVRGSAKSGHLSGLVNAVARKVAEEGAEVWLEQPPQPLPSWLAKPVSKNFGKDVVPAIELAHQKGAPIDLTLKEPDKAEDWADRLNAKVLPTGSLRLKGRPQITALEGFETGDWWVQDAAAALPARLLADVKGLNVLDLCAAPGGKTMQLAAAGAKVTALDISAQRLERLSENLDRVRLSAELITANLLDWNTSEKYDAILLDAPCSATGTIRRHPDLPFAKAGADMSGLFQLQADMIDKSAALLKSGGRMTYCTCSLLPREGETQIETALERNPELSLLQLPEDVSGIDADWKLDTGALRTRPDYWPVLGGLDGFFMAVLQKS